MRNFIRGGAVAYLLAACITAGAQTYPDRPIRFIAPTTPGPTADMVARVVAEAMSRALKQPVIVENKPGAEQIVGLEGTDQKRRAQARVSHQGHPP